MSLVPMLFSDWWEDLDRPHSLFDQHFGLTLDPEELIHRTSATRHAEQAGYPFFRRIRRRYHPFHHALARKSSGKTSSLTQAEKDKDRFYVTIDVRQFLPDEITVKVVDKCVVVEAKHDEREDEHGFISRQFTRKYPVAGHYDIDQLESTLSSDGVLTIMAPRKKPMNVSNNERSIKIQYTGEPAIFEQRETRFKANESRESDSTPDYPQQRSHQQQMGQRGKKMTVKGS